MSTLTKGAALGILDRLLAESGGGRPNSIAAQLRSNGESLRAHISELHDELEARRLTTTDLPSQEEMDLRDALDKAERMLTTGQGDVERLTAEVERLNAIINTPQSGDFLRAVSIEAEHQRQRWAHDHDAGKTHADWYWLVGYLAGKALHAAIAGDSAKAEHHMITTAAACENWKRAVFGETTMRPGIDGEAALRPFGQQQEAT